MPLDLAAALRLKLLQNRAALQRPFLCYLHLLAVINSEKCQSEMCVPAAAKNVILAGVKSVTLLDTANVELRDLSAQFYLDEADVGANRAQACYSRLQELNPAVTVSASQENLSEGFLSKFQASEAADIYHTILAGRSLLW